MTWSATRAPLLPIAWVLAHATVLLWKALDPGYINEAQWIVDFILKPTASACRVAGICRHAPAADFGEQHAPDAS
jgi:hypothetical protein